MKLIQHGSIYSNIIFLLLFKRRKGILFFFFFSSRRRHTRWPRDWSSDVCSSDLAQRGVVVESRQRVRRATAGADADDDVLRTDTRRREIGRASCRERV